MAISISGVSTTNDCNNYVHLKDAYSPRKLMIKASDGLTKSDTLHNDPYLPVGYDFTVPDTCHSTSSTIDPMQTSGIPTKPACVHHINVSFFRPIRFVYVAKISNVNPINTINRFISLTPFSVWVVFAMNCITKLPLSMAIKIQK